MTPQKSVPEVLRAAADVVRLHAALKRITQYQSPDRLRRDSEKDWGLGYEEALEYAYENVLSEAASAIKGLRVAKYRAALTRAADLADQDREGK